MRAAVIALGLSLLTPALRAQVARATLPRDVGVDAAMRQMLDKLGVADAGLVVVRDGVVVHHACYGEFASDRPIPIASASKWLTVATVLTLVDEGKLALDAAVMRYLPEFDVPDRRALTLRRCLSCTNGLPAYPTGARDADATTESLAAAFARARLREPVGTALRYGGGGFQVAARVAEVVSGSAWHELFAARIAAPLGMRGTTFGRLAPIGADAGETRAPWVAGGGLSTLDDYARFVEMLAGRGVFRGTRVLSGAMVDAMFTDAARDLPRAFSPYGAADFGYGLGTWIEATDAQGRAALVSDAGAFGWTPWLDLGSGYAAVLGIRDRFQRVHAALPPVREAAAAARVNPAQVEPARDATHELEHGGRTRRYHVHVPPRGAEDDGLPVMLVFHGGGGHGEQVAKSTGFSALADREGFVVVYPDGTGRLAQRLLTWNCGGLPCYASEQKVDDVGFVRALLADLTERERIDPARVYATGMSNGAMMVHRLARECPDLLAAVAPVAGAMSWTEASPKLPMPILIVHGRKDQHVLFEGGKPKAAVGRAGERVDASVADSLAYYRARNGQTGEPQRTKIGAVETTRWEQPAQEGEKAAPVVLVAIDGEGHTWPGGARGRLGADAPTKEFSATEEIWRFCRAQRR